MMEGEFVCMCNGAMRDFHGGEKVVRQDCSFISLQLCVCESHRESIVKETSCVNSDRENGAVRDVQNRSEYVE